MLPCPIPLESPGVLPSLGEIVASGGNRFPTPASTDFANIVRVTDVNEAGDSLLLNVDTDGRVQEALGYLAEKR